MADRTVPADRLDEGIVTEPGMPSTDVAVGADERLNEGAAVAQGARLAEGVAHPGRVLFIASALHLCNDAFFAVFYPLLPFIAAELSLSYAEVGMLKAAFVGSAAILQLPAGLLAERLGEYLLLAWGNGWVAAGIVGMAAATSFPVLLLAAVLGGLGGNVQHPLAASMVARAYEGGRRATAVGTLNFAGDLGKMAAPALVTFTTLTFGWRTTLVALGLFGIVFSIGVGLAKRWVQPPSVVEQAAHAVGGEGVMTRLAPAYWILMLVGIFDASTRAAALTFLPFVLDGRGVSPTDLGLLLGLLFAGGAAGKLICGALGDRLGPFAVVGVTEVTTALALLGLAWGPMWTLAGLAVVFGFALNGTSSVFYAAVAGFAPDGRRGRAYGLYYTGTQGAAAVAPLAYGLLADWRGLDPAIAAISVVTVLIVPLAVPIRRRLAM
ncbi:MAG: MFS transporter [Chloroflexi bacterium]|nr:MFS transporter [Chloroflexota bacterium]